MLGWRVLISSSASSVYSPTSAALAMKPSSNSLMVASAAAQESGLPPKVLPCDPRGQVMTLSFARMAPIGIPEQFDDHVTVSYNLMHLAFQGDITRVSSLMVGRDVSLRSFPESGVTTVWHSSSHHGEDVKRRDDYAKMNRYHIRTFAYFLDKLKKTQDGDGNLLDHSLVLYGSPMGDGSVHNHLRIPIFLAEIGRAHV